jgi:sulfur carrier protein
MMLTVNGEPREVAAESTVDDLVAAIRPERRGVAVAVNGEVAPRTSWTTCRLQAGDAIEVITAVQGG